MKTRVLGNSGIEVSEIGLGCMGMSHAYGPVSDRKEMVDLIKKSLELGCNFFDTAVVYGLENEKFIGCALSQNRSQAVIATKFGIVGQKIVDGQPVNILDSKPESIRKQVEASLKRLNTDYIDLYYQHRVDSNVEPEVVAQVMDDLICEEKIRSWGLSNPPLDYLIKAHEVCPVSALENQYSLLWREPEKEVFDLCKKLNIAFIAYSPLGNGFLTTKYSKNYNYPKGDFRNFMSRFKPDVMDANEKVLDLVRYYASLKEVTPAQIVLAWELAQRQFIIPIPGTRKIHRLEENIASSDVVFTNKELREFNDALSQIDVDESFF